MHQASIPVFVRGLNVLSGLLRKGEAHARENGLDPACLIGARLAPDMLPLSGQVQRASDTSKLSGVRLSGVAAPSFPDTETTFPELQERIAKTVAYLDGIPPDALEGSEDKPIGLKFGTRQVDFTGTSYLLTFALPNFFFHVATAHGILRHRGVAVGKIDYLGGDPASAGR
jgi:hypothetical protein